MATLSRAVKPTGTLSARHRKAPRQDVGLAWKWRNLPNLWRGTWRNKLAEAVSQLTGIPVLTAELKATLIKASGLYIEYGVVSRMVVTDTGVAFLVDDWDDDTTDITDMNFHACGTGVAAEDQTDTALGTESTTITDRGTGAKTQPTANQIRSTATQDFTGAGAITEHGLFSIVTEEAGVMWDRSVFAAINVGNGDSIQWQYTLTITAGG